MCDKCHIDSPRAFSHGPVWPRAAGESPLLQSAALRVLPGKSSQAVLPTRRGPVAAGA